MNMQIGMVLLVSLAPIYCRQSEVCVKLSYANTMLYYDISCVSRAIISFIARSGSSLRDFAWSSSYTTMHELSFS